MWVSQSAEQNFPLFLVSTFPPPLTADSCSKHAATYGRCRNAPAEISREQQLTGIQANLVDDIF